VLVTIVTPSLNGMEFLRECIESTRRQQTRNVDVEHVFVDGGSTDGTVEFAASQGCTVLTREERSVFAARNKGSYNSNGTLLGSIGCDDIFLPGALDAVVRHYERTGAQWLVGGCRWMDERGGPRGDLRAPPRWLSVPMYVSLGWNCFPDISTFVHRELFLQLKGYDSDFMYAGDYDFYARALQHGSFARIKRTLTGVRHHGTNLSMVPDPRRLAEDKAMVERYGPESRWRRAAYRGLLKVWLNGTNPRWFVYKRIDGLRARHMAQSSSA
jgi:glycosyltransferase involved in cell wall biosynthesis